MVTCPLMAPLESALPRVVLAVWAPGATVVEVVEVVEDPVVLAAGVAAAGPRVVVDVVDDPVEAEFAARTVVVVEALGFVLEVVDDGRVVVVVACPAVCG